MGAVDEPLLLFDVDVPCDDVLLALVVVGGVVELEEVWLPLLLLPLELLLLLLLEEDELDEEVVVALGLICVQVALHGVTAVKST